jgi:hypothetical protein
LAEVGTQNRIGSGHLVEELGLPRVQFARACVDRLGLSSAGECRGGLAVAAKALEGRAAQGVVAAFVRIQGGQCSERPEERI